MQRKCPTCTRRCCRDAHVRRRQSRWKAASPSSQGSDQSVLCGQRESRSGGGGEGASPGGHGDRRSSRTERGRSRSRTAPRSPPHQARQGACPQQGPPPSPPDSPAPSGGPAPPHRQHGRQPRRAAHRRLHGGGGSRETSAAAASAAGQWRERRSEAPGGPAFPETKGLQMGPCFGGRAEAAPHTPVAPSPEGGWQKQPCVFGAGKKLWWRFQRLTSGGHQCHRLVCGVPLDSALWVRGPTLVLALVSSQQQPGLALVMEVQEKRALSPAGSSLKTNTVEVARQELKSNENHYFSPSSAHCNPHQPRGAAGAPPALATTAELKDTFFKLWKLKKNLKYYDGKGTRHRLNILIYNSIC